VPSEPEESRFCQKIKLKSYPLVRVGEVLWNLYGAAGADPAAAGMGIRHRRPEQSYISKRLQECNWLQALEGASIPATHHGCTAGSSRSIRCIGLERNQYNLGDARPHFEVVESPGGLLIGARRSPTPDATTGASRNGSCRASP